MHRFLLVPFTSSLIPPILLTRSLEDQAHVSDSQQEEETVEKNHREWRPITLLRIALSSLEGPASGGRVRL